jgi:hypothetical protein
MNLLKKISEKNNGDYSEENIKETYSTIGTLIYQPKKAQFTIDGSKLSVNLNEVGGAIPSADPFRITLYLKQKLGQGLEVYPATFWERIFHDYFPSTNKVVIDGYAFKSDAAIINTMLKDVSFFRKLKKQNVYIRIPLKDTSKIILTPPNGIENEAAFEGYITILKSLEEILTKKND